MDVTSTATTATASTVKASGASSFVATDFQTFLKMLTTQLQNQDPLNPMESSDFAVQLATFSGVEQQVRTNDLLGSLASTTALSGIGQYAGWIGMEARVPAAVPFNGSPLTLYPTPAAGADSAQLVVSDAEGKAVMTVPAALDGAPVTWAGVTASGNPLPDGQYTFTLQSYREGKLVGTDPVGVFAKVVETRVNADGTPMLILEGGAEVAARAATALRQVN